MSSRSTGAVRLPKKAEVVARRISSMIFEEALAPGTPLPNEPEMLAQFQVARSTLREALRLLETQGVLSLQAGRSPVVRRPVADDLVNSLTLLLQFQGATFATLLQARSLFEPAIAAEAARRADPDGIAALRRNIDAARADAPHPVGLRVRRELEFHRLLAEVSGNPLAHVVVATMTTILANEFIDTGLAHDFDAEIDVHVAIVDAIEERDTERAAQLLRRHVDELVSEAFEDHPALLTRPIRWI